MGIRISHASYDGDAFHKSVKGEIEDLPLQTTIDPSNDLFIMEIASLEFEKRKVVPTSISFPGMDTVALHYSDIDEFQSFLSEKAPFGPQDLLIIEDEGDSYTKKYGPVQAITIDIIGDGTTYKKFTAAEQLKLSGIEENADVTTTQRVSDALNLLSVTELSDISSPGANIEDAVTKRHLQGTDTTLGILASNIDMGGNEVVNAADPTTTQSLATKNYVDVWVNTKQDTLTNGLPSLTTDEVSQIANIDTQTVSTESWGVVSALVGSPLWRQIDSSPAAVGSPQYIPLISTINDTTVTFGKYHFYLYQQNGTTSSEYIEIIFDVPQNCFYDGSSLPPFLNATYQGIGTHKSYRLIVTNNGTTNSVSLYLEIRNNTDGIFELWTKDFSDATIGSLLSGGTVLTTLSNQSYRIDLIRGGVHRSFLSGSGAVKIASNGDLSKPQYTLVPGTPQRITYLSPILALDSYPPPIGPQDISCIYDVSTNIFLENKILGQPQYWRFTCSYSGKPINNNTGLYFHITNPVSGFLRRLLVILPMGEVGNNYITFDLSTYADDHSLSSPLGTGLGGYEFYLEVIDVSISIVVEDITRLTYGML